MAASDLGDADKTFFAGDKSLEAGGTNNTSNQFEVSEKPKKIKKNSGKSSLINLKKICVKKKPL